MILLSDASKQNKEQFQQNLEIRVLLFKGKAKAEAETGSWSAPVFSLAAACFVRRIGFAYSGTTLDLLVSYSHDGVSFEKLDVAQAMDSGSQVVDFLTPVWCSFVRVQTLAADGSVGTPSFAVAVYGEDFFDVSREVKGGVALEFGKDKELGFHRMPVVSMTFENSRRYYNRRNADSPYWDAARGVSYCRANARLMVLCMYRGADGGRAMRDDGYEDWTPLATFEAETWQSDPETKTVSVQGKCGKILLKSTTTQPLLEITTPLELVRRIVRDDDSQRLLLPVNPAAHMKTETVVNEYVGKGETCGGLWDVIASLTDCRIVDVPHPWFALIGGTYNFDGKMLHDSQAAGARVRLGACSDGIYIYALLFVRDDGWFIERISFQGEILGSQRLSSVDTHYFQDVTLVGEYLYITKNTEAHAYILKANKSLTDAIVELVDYEITLVGGSFVGYYFYGITYYAALGALIVQAVYVDGVPATPKPLNALTFFVNPATGTYATAGLVSGGPVAEYLEMLNDGMMLWHETAATHISVCPAGIIQETATYPLLFDDSGGAIVIAGSQLYLFRHDLGIGVIARWGLWLENGNIQYAGAAGFDEALDFLQPSVYVDNQLQDGTGSVAGNVLSTDDYVLNLRTGELRFKSLLPNETRVKASYDFKYSFQYVRIEKENRLDCLNNMALSNNYLLFVNGTNELQFRDRLPEEVFVCWTAEDGVATGVRLGDAYLAGGLPFVIHGSNTAYRWNTVKVWTADRALAFTEGVDFTVTYSGGRTLLNFLNTEKVRDAGRCRVQYRVQEEIPVLRDVRHIVQGGVDERWGDAHILNDVTVTGEKQLPGDNAISIVQTFALSPNEKKQSSRFQNVQESVPQGLFDWNPATKVVDDDSKPDALKKYFIEFDSPLVLGTSGYEVEYGDARDGSASGAFGILNSGTQSHNGSLVSARFYKVALGVTARDMEYFVMVDDNREWRVATAEDFADMAGNTVGGDPSSANDVKTTTKFYLKQMNGNYGKKMVHFVAYYSVRVRYYLDVHGRVMEDAEYDPNDPAKNPYHTVTPDKRMAITLTPQDERQNPLFPFHAESGRPGFYSDAVLPAGMNFFTGVLREFSVRISKVWADMLGVNFDFDNWWSDTQFVAVATTGYPLATLEKFEGRAPATYEDVALYGLREKQVESKYIANIMAARNLARALRESNRDEPESFSVEVLFDASLTVDTLVNVQESFSGIDELFDVVELRHSLEKERSTTRLTLEDV